MRKSMSIAAAHLAARKVGFIDRRDQGGSLGADDVGDDGVAEIDPTVGGFLTLDAGAKARIPEWRRPAARPPLVSGIAGGVAVARCRGHQPVNELERTRRRQAPPRRTLAAAAAVVMLAASATAETYQLPRATGQMAVNATVECVAPEGDATGCTVSHHCATVDDWAQGIPPADFRRTLPEIPVGVVRWVPTTTSARHLCAVHVEGEANVTGFRHHRHRVDGEWLQLSRESVPIHHANSLVSVAIAAPQVGVLSDVMELLGVESAEALIELYCADFVEGSQRKQNCLDSNTFLLYGFAYVTRDDYSVCLVDAIVGYWQRPEYEGIDLLLESLEGLRHALLNGTADSRGGYADALRHCEDLRPRLDDLP